MKILINEKLWNKMEKFSKGGDKPNILKTIDTNAKQALAVTQTPEAFFSKMADEITKKAKKDNVVLPEPFMSINSLTDVLKGSTNSEYMAKLVLDNDDFYSDVLIAYADKSGNTLIAQQFSTFIYKKVEEEQSIDYLYRTGHEKLIYLTYDIKKKGYAALVQTSVRSALTLGFSIVEMFPSDQSLIPFSTAKEAYEQYSSHSTAKNTGIDHRDGKIILKKKNATKMGSTLYPYGLWTLAYYKLSHPELGFDEISFEMTDQDGNPLKISTNPVTKFLNSLFNGDFVTGHAFQEFDINNYTKPDPKSESNLLIYGAPGTGKSYYVQHNLLPKYKNYERVTFFAEYDYADFVGDLKPVTTDSGRVSYDFVPGAFTRILTKALNDPANSYALVIEELNRANASAVFGEVFQLLDRNDDGISEFAVFNKPLADYLNKNVTGFTNFNLSGIKIPGNMAIIATMNPSDQNVQKIDAAFKRRWDMKYLTIDFSKDPIGKEKVVGFDKSWQEVAEAINNYLLKKPIYAEEDELLAPHFMTKKQLNDINKVADKILGYLWNDVGKYHRDTIFKVLTLSEAIKLFCDKKIQDVFSDDFRKDTSL